MKASLVAIATRANRRALSRRSSFLAAASCRTIGFHACGPVTNQKRAIAVCSAVRLVLVRPPTSLISFRSLVQTSESSAGGGAGRNCDPDVIVHGLTAPSVELTGMTVGTQTRVAVTGR